MDLIRRIVDGRTDLVFDHLAAGGGARDADENGVPPVRWCAYYGDVSAIRRLLDGGAALADLSENLDLNGAAFHGWWRLCQFLLEAGADPNHPLPDTGETPLHAALSRRPGPAADHVVRVLLEAGADPHRRTSPGAPTGAFMRDSRTRGETPLHRAAAFGTEEGIRLLIEAGAALDVRDMHGDSPLSWASWARRSRAVLKLLCFDGLDVNVLPYDGLPGVEAMDVALLGRPHPA